MIVALEEAKRRLAALYDVVGELKNQLRIDEAKEKCAELGVSPYIQVDGGINGETAEGAAAAGANVLVSGTYLIRAESPADAVKSLKLKQ